MRSPEMWSRTTRTLGLGAALLGAALPAACAGTPEPTTAVVAITVPTGPVTAEAAPADSAVPAPPRKPVPRGMAAVWRDMETGSLHTFVEEAGEITVVSVIDVGGESYEVRDVSWKDGVLEWSYFVPSTGYVVHLKTLLLDGDRLSCAWSNDHGASGEQDMERAGHD